jgi:hypothetical protein
MADVLLGIAIGLGLGALLAWVRRREPEVRPAPRDQPPAGTDQADAAARLQGMTAELMAVGDASAHPREVGSHPLFREAVALLASEQFPLTQVIDYAVGANWMLSAAALAALGQRPDRTQAAAAVARQFRHLRPWPIFYALKFFLTLEDRPAPGYLMLGTGEYWAEHPLVPSLMAEHLTARATLGDLPGFGGALAEATAEELEAATTLLRAVRHPSAQALLDELGAWRRQSLDRTFLQTVGRFVERDREQALRIEHEAIRQPLAAAEQFLLTQPARSTLVIGEPRAGKTAFVMLLMARAIERGWSVFEAGAAGLMSGQQYFGQLEERLSRLTAELAAEKRVIWYVPDFLQLATSGVHSSHTASLLEQVLPAITSGRVVMVSETTPAALTSLQERVPALRSAFELVRLRPLTDAECDRLTHDLAGRLQAATRIEIGAEVTSTVLQLARQYLGSGMMPGTALDLLKLTAQRVQTDGDRKIVV